MRQYVLTFIAGAVTALAIATAVLLAIDTGFECPTQVEAATRMRLFYAEAPPALTEYDNEFAAACDLNWESPVRIEPLERGA